jgi:hypothetical protein
VQNFASQRNDILAFANPTLPARPARASPLREGLWLTQHDFLYLDGIVGFLYPLLKKALTLTADTFSIMAAVLIILDTILIYPAKAAFY